MIKPLASTPYLVLPCATYWGVGSAANAQAMTPPLSILVVSDDAGSRLLIRKLLADDADVRIVTECSSIAQCEQLGESIVPELVLLDVRMPDRDGIELVKWFDTRGIDPLIIVVCTHARYAVQAFTIGAIDYLLKPFDHKRFETAMQRSKAIWSASRRRLQSPR